MSVRYEWMHLPDVTFVPDGFDVTTGEAATEETADEHVVEYGGALVLSGDEVTVVTGSPEALLKWARDIVTLMEGEV